MQYFISDLHFGHANIIKLCGRPFANVAEMDAALIANWNRRVTNNDTIYIMGDLCFRTADPTYYLEKLKGKKHLILGNHDKDWVRYVPDLSAYFVNCKDKSDRGHWMDVVTTNYGKLTLCHFPMMDFVGRYLIYGHIHNNQDDPYWTLLSSMENTLNAGADINGFTPVTFSELLENNRRFRTLSREKA